MRSNPNVIEQHVTLREALARLNSLSGREMTLFVVDTLDNLTVMGTLTDGDVRRALLAGRTLESDVAEAMCRNFRYLTNSNVDQVDSIRGMRRRGINMIPVVDREGRLVEITDLNRRTSRLPLSAILMAGGKGERLRPLTNHTPKPLLQVDGKAIIDYNVEALARVGINDITVTTRYLAEQIHDHFAAPVAGVNVKCVTERIPMGTLGSASLVSRPEKGHTLIMNSDLLTSISFEDMYLKHRNNDAAVTVGVIPYQVSVPYAILDVDDNKVIDINEKPSFSHFANAGIYIFRNDILNRLMPNESIDTPDFIRRVIAEGFKVTYFVIDGTWIDIGSHTDYVQAVELMRHHRNLNESRDRID